MYPSIRVYCSNICAGLYFKYLFWKYWYGQYQKDLSVTGVYYFYEQCTIKCEACALRNSLVVCLCFIISRFFSRTIKWRQIYWKAIDKAIFRLFNTIKYCSCNWCLMIFWKQSVIKDFYTATIFIHHHLMDPDHF